LHAPAQFGGVFEGFGKVWSFFLFFRGRISDASEVSEKKSDLDTEKGHYALLHIIV